MQGTLPHDSVWTQIAEKKAFNCPRYVWNYVSIADIKVVMEKNPGTRWEFEMLWREENG